MKKISNSSELSKYYSEVNRCIDEYISLHRVTPSEIYRYITKNLSRFIEKFGFKDVDGIERIIKDVIEHKKNMEKDKVFKFEQFSSKLNESILDIGSVGIDHEKTLADYYNTSLGHIEPIDPAVHLYEIKDFDKTTKSIIFSADEIDSIKSRLSQKMIEELSKKEIILDSIDGNYLPTQITFLVGSIISLEELENNIKTKLDSETLIKVVTSLIPNRLVGSESSTCKFNGVFNGYYIWTV